MHFQGAALSLLFTIVDTDNGYAIAPMRQGLRLTTVPRAAIGLNAIEKSYSPYKGLVIAIA